MPAAAKPSPREAGQNTEHKSIPFEVKAVQEPGAGGDDAPGGSFEGIGGCFHNIDTYGDIIVPGAFQADLPEFLKNGFIGGVNHNWDGPIGHPFEAEEVDSGLRFKGVFDATPDAQATREKMRVNPRTGRATIRRLSIGYKTLQAESLRTDAAVRSYWEGVKYTPTPGDLERLRVATTTAQRGPDGKVVKDKAGKEVMVGIRLLKRLSLYEVSPVAVPANERAEVISSKYYGDYGPSIDPTNPSSLLGDTNRVIAYTAMSRLHDMLCMAIYAILGNDGNGLVPLDVRLGLINDAITEFRDALIPMLQIFLGDDTATNGADDAAEEVGVAQLAKQFRARFGLEFDAPAFAAKLAVVTAPGFAEQSQTVVSAVEGFVDRAEARVDARLKDGRELSGSNRSALQGVRDGLRTHADAIDAMLSRTEKKPSEATTQPETEAKAAGRIDPTDAEAVIQRHQDTTRAAEWMARIKG